MDGWIGQVLLMVSNCTTTPDRAWLVPPMSIHPSGSLSSRYCCCCAGSDAGWLWIVMDRPVGRSLNNWKLADAQLALTLRCRCRPALLLLLLLLQFPRPWCRLWCGQRAATCGGGCPSWRHRHRRSSGTEHSTAMSWCMGSWGLSRPGAACHGGKWSRVLEMLNILLMEIVVQLSGKARWLWLFTWHHLTLIHGHIAVSD